MNTDPQTEYTAELAERTVCVTWPDNERRGATPPPDGWQDTAFSSQPTLHEVDEGSPSGCSVLRWRDDPRPDAELLAVSLALVTGKPAPAAPVAAPPTGQAVAEPVNPCTRGATFCGQHGYDCPPLAGQAGLRDRIAKAVDEGFRLHAELEDSSLGNSITDSVLTAVLAALPADPQPTAPAVVAEPGKENDPRAICVCSHTRAVHLTVSGRLLCDECDPDSTENLVCKGFEAL